MAGVIGNILSPVAKPLGLDTRVPTGPITTPDVRFMSGQSELGKEGVTIDPRIAALKGEGLGFAQQSLGDIQAGRRSVIGDRGTFVQRRTAGLREGIQQRQQELGQRLQRTGVTGQFAQQSKQAFTDTANQKITRGESLATEELAGLEGSFDQLEGGANQLIENINAADFAQQLSARGMSRDLAAKLTSFELQKRGIATGKAQSNQQMLGNLALTAAMFLI